MTHFTLKTIPVTPVVYGGYVGSNEASFPRMFTALADYNTAGFDPKAHVIVTFIKFGNLTLSENIYFYQDPNVTGTPAVFKKLQNIDPPNLLLNDVRFPPSWTDPGETTKLLIRCMCWYRLGNAR